MMAFARAQDPWDRLHDALWQASDGQYEAATQELTALVRTLPGEDPARSKAMFHLARLYWLLGKHTDAEDILRDGVRTGACGGACRALLGHIALNQAAVRQAPTHWSFEDPSHGVFHPWEFGDRGSVRTISGGEDQDARLQWSTRSESRYPDQLVIAFSSPQPPVREVRVAIRAEGRDAYVRLEAVDDQGQVFTWGPAGMALPVDETLQLRVHLDRMTSTESPSLTLDPSRLALLRLVDSSALDGDLDGPVLFLIDDLALLP